MSFVHLHNHSSHSILDGAAAIAEMVQAAKKLGQPALALTDHGSLTGAYEFYKECTKAGVKPIIGIEAYLAPTPVAVRTPTYWGTDEQRRHDVSRGAYLHITLLAKDAEGLRNLYKIHSLSQQGDRSYYKPRVDLKLLDEYGTGIIATTGCAGGAIATALRLEQPERARQWMADLTETLGHKNVYVELMYHGITDENGDGFDELKLNEQLRSLAAEFALPTVMTNDCHYVAPKDAVAHDALLCIQTRALLSDEKRFRFTGDGFYLKSFAEMVAVAKEAGIPLDAVTNTAKLAALVSDYAPVFEHKLRMPSVPGADIRTLATQSERYKSEYQGRLDHELSVIQSQGFEDYFLVLSDSIGWAKAHEIAIGPGRGSAAGSLVAYLLGITDVDPVAHGLLFERFLNPERVSLPDIDFDVEDGRRDDLLTYLRSRWGAEYVAHILTFTTTGAKTALKDASRILGHPFAKGVELCGYMPPDQFGKAADLSAMPPMLDPEDKEIVKLAKGLEGLIRGTGVHASGMIVSPEPLVDILPVVWKDGVQLTSWDQGAVEAMGLVKMDYLGLRNLDVIRETLEMIQWKWGDLLTMPMDDKATYQMLASGNTAGVFQLDSEGMQRLLRAMRPTCFEDISAVLALYRPGPMGAKAHHDYADRKNRRKPITPIDPELSEALEPILRDTYGVIVYQEQVMAIAQKVAGYSLGKADLLRRAMGKKKKEILEAEFGPFRDGMRANGYSDVAIEALWEVLVPFSDYAFNKAHTVSYGMISYWTAYLKTHHPKEYMTRLLCSVSDKPERLGPYLAEVERMGIKMLPPDVNAPTPDFTPSEEGIHYGLSAIKGFGENAFAQLKKESPYMSIDDFFRRAPGQVLNVAVLKSLIRSGALDRLESRRHALDEAAERLAGRALNDRKEAKLAKRQVFRMAYGIDALNEEIEDAEQYRLWEDQYLGVTLTKGRLYLHPKHDLSEDDWVWVSDLVANCPGDDQVYVVFGPVIVDTGYTLDIEAAKDRLVTLAAFDLDRLRDPS